MQEEKYSDEDLISMVRAGGKDLEEISMYMFHEFKSVLPDIKSKLDLPQQQMQDAYSEALVKMIRHLRDGTFEEGNKVSIYFHLLFHNTVLEISSKQVANENIMVPEFLEHDAREWDLLTLVGSKNAAAQVVPVMGAMGDLCRRILMDWGFYSFTMSEIATRSDLSNADSAINMKSKCLKNLRELLNAKMYNV